MARGSSIQRLEITVPNEDTTTTDGEQEQAATAAKPAEKTGDDETLGEGGKKALSAEREARKAAEKRAADLEAKVKDFETAQMSELEKAQQAAQEWQQKAEAATADALRLTVASRHGITADDAAVFLTGTTEEDLTAQATRLAALASADPGMKPDMSQGAGGDAPKQTTGQKFAAAFEGRI